MVNSELYGSFIRVFMLISPSLISALFFPSCLFPSFANYYVICFPLPYLSSPLSPISLSPFLFSLFLFQGRTKKRRNWGFTVCSKSPSLMRLKLSKNLHCPSLHHFLPLLSSLCLSPFSLLFSFPLPPFLSSLSLPRTLAGHKTASH